MPLNYDTAKAVVEEAHRAWSAGDIDAVLRTYTDDIWFQRNSSDLEVPPYVIRGREAMGVFLRDVVQMAEGMAVLESFQFHSGIARSRVSYFLKDRKTGQSLTATYRQIAVFRNMQISRIEQFHDAARLSAFFRLIEVPTSPARDDRRLSDAGGASRREE
jgi:ketosteroid isomerase-like protein